MAQHSEPVRHHEPEAAAPTPAPAPAAFTPAPIAQPVAFHAVSEHDAVAEETHKPVRRRKDHVDGGAQETSLQLVETQVEVQPAMLAADEEPVRRTKPRRRRGGPVESEPLMLVETQPGADTARPDPQA
jgi:hypothetical protein